MLSKQIINLRIYYLRHLWAGRTMQEHNHECYVQCYQSSSRRSYCCQTLFVCTNFIARSQTSPWHLAWHYPAQHWTNLVAPVKELRMFCRIFRTSPCPIIWLFARTLSWQVCETTAECLMVVRKANKKTKQTPQRTGAVLSEDRRIQVYKKERKSVKKKEIGKL